MKALYISYDGALESLGQSQVIPYLKGLSQKGIQFILITFEKKEDIRKKDDVKAMKGALKNYGIHWIGLRYHKWPSIPATFFDIIQGIIVGGYCNCMKNIEIVHARSYVSALMALVFKKIFQTRFIFDMRGFWADEIVEAGRWRKGIIYKIAKYLEKVYLLSADNVVVLSESAKREIEKFDYLKHKKINIEVIPTCVDLEKFSLPTNKTIKRNQEFTFIYSGSYGPGSWYMLEEMLELFKIARLKLGKIRFIFLSTMSPRYLFEIISRKGLDKNDFIIGGVPYDEMPLWIPKAHAALFFIKPTFSKKGTCATKLGEFLACGVPVVINAKIGDSDEIIERERIGVVIREFSQKEYTLGLELLTDLLKTKDLAQRCRNAALKYFSLEKAIEKYYSMYT